MINASLGLRLWGRQVAGHTTVRYARAGRRTGAGQRGLRRLLVSPWRRRLRRWASALDVTVLASRSAVPPAPRCWAPAKVSRSFAWPLVNASVPKSPASAPTALVASLVCACANPIGNRDQPRGLYLLRTALHIPQFPVHHPGCQAEGHRPGATALPCFIVNVVLTCRRRGSG